MKNYFKKSTVDSIVTSLTKTVSQLDKVREESLYEADLAEEVIEGMKQVREEKLIEAARAEKVANNVKKLLDIN